MLVETARDYWIFSQRMNRSSEAARRLILQHEILPAAYAEVDDKKRGLLFRLAAKAEAA